MDLWWRLRDSNPSKCKKPVASCGHQFKNWWQPYALPGAKRPSSPVVLPVHEKSGLFHIVGVCFLGFGIFKQKFIKFYHYFVDITNMLCNNNKKFTKSAFWPLKISSGVCPMKREAGVIPGRSRHCDSQDAA